MPVILTTKYFDGVFRGTVALVAFLVVGSVTLSVSSVAFANERLDAAATNVLKNAIERDTLAGLSAGILVDGEIVWQGAAGFADIENRVPASPQMVHRIASISKPMTAVAVMQLVESGQLDLEATLSELISFPEKPWPVRVRQVLGHTSGIRHYKIGGARTMKHYRHLEGAIRIFKDDPLDFEPDTSYGYTTFGYVTLGAVIEKVTGQEYEDYMRDHVWGPAGMDTTCVERRDEMVPKRARGYALNRDGDIVNARYSDISMKIPGGGLLSTVGDLLRFVKAFESDRLVNAEIRQRMLTPAMIDGQSTGYGLGWNVQDASSHGPVYAHSGGQSGTSTLLVVYRDHGVAIAVISNREGWGEAGQVINELANLVID